MPESTQTRCYRVIATEFEVDAKSLSDDIDISVAWGMDDLDVIQLTYALGSEFDLAFDEAEIEAAVTVGDIIRLIDSKLQLRETDGRHPRGKL